MFKLTKYVKRDSTKFALQIMTPYGYREHEEPTNSLNIALFARSWWFKIPEIIKPKKVVNTYTTDEGTTSSYNSYVQCQYGFSICDDAVHFYYGIRPGTYNPKKPKESDHSKVWFIPWLSTRRTRYDFLDFNHNFVCSAPDKPNGAIDFDSICRAESIVPKKYFKLVDFDDQEIIASVYIEEMRWEYGTGLFKWVKWFKKPIIRRRLNIDLNKEIGPKKGSWKGGLTGTSVDIESGESALSAIQRWIKTNTRDVSGVKSVSETPDPSLQIDKIKV